MYNPYMNNMNNGNNQMMNNQRMNVQPYDYSNQMNNQNMNMNLQSMQTVQQQFLKGRPVSSYDEAKASMIDFDGSLFVFTDIANNKIYTKQVLLDGTAELKTYVLEDMPRVEEQKQEQTKSPQNYVLKKDFDKFTKSITKEIDKIKGVLEDDTTNGK